MPRLIPLVTLLVALGFAGASLAQPLLAVDATVETPFGSAHVDAEVPMPDALAPERPPEPPAQRYKLTLLPESQNATPGETVVFDVRLDAREPRTIRLTLANVTLGFDARLDDDVLRVRPNETTNTSLRVTAPRTDNATWGAVLVEAVADEDGEKHAAKATVRVASTTPPPPPPAAPFTLTMEPKSQNATTGDRVHYTVRATSTRPVDLHLSLDGPGGFAASLSPTHMRLGPNETGLADLWVDVLTTSDTTAVFTVNATDAHTNFTRIAYAYLHVRGGGNSTPPPGNDTTPPPGNGTAGPADESAAAAPAAGAAPPARPVETREGERGPGLEGEASVALVEARVAFSTV